MTTRPMPPDSPDMAISPMLDAAIVAQLDGKMPTEVVKAIADRLSVVVPLSEVQRIARRQRHIQMRREAGARPAGSYHKKLPDDFAERSATMNNAELMRHYSIGAGTLNRFRKESNTPSPNKVCDLKPMPENFVTLAPTMTRNEIKRNFGIGDTRLNRYLAETGITPRANPGRGRGRYLTSTAAPEDTRMLSKADLAAEYLKRFGPIYRCDWLGRPDPKGKKWRRGSAVLTADEVIERAIYNRWEPDAWQKVA